MNIEEQQRIIAELKAEALANPVTFNAAGRLIVPKNLPMRELVVEGFKVRVGMTYDQLPLNGFKCEHLSMVGVTQHPMPEEVQKKVKELVFGNVPGVQKFDSPVGVNHQYIRVIRTSKLN